MQIAILAGMVPIGSARRALPALATVAAALLAWPAAAGTAPANAALAKLADDSFELRLRSDSLAATEEVGDPRFEGELVIDIAPEQRQEQAAECRRLLAALKKIPLKQLSAADRLTYDVLQYDLSMRLAGLRFPRHLLPIHHMESVPVKLAGWAGGQSVQPFKTVKNYDNFLARIERLRLWSEQAIANLKEGARSGIVAPKEIVERALPQLSALADSTPGESAFFSPINRLPEDFPAADKARLTAAYREAVATRLLPALKALRDFVRDQYLPRTRGSAGIGALPGGAAWYRHAVREATTTLLSADTIHATGLREVARILAEMDQVQAAIGFVGTRAEFNQSLATRPALFPYKTEAEVIAAFNTINNRVKPKLADMFGRLPKAPLEIRGVDPLLRDTASSSYILPTQDGSRLGVFYAVVPDPLKYSTPSMAALMLHEGQPGHHFHQALQQELDIPTYRQFIWYDAFGEGWALYAESLGRALGVYDDPYAYLGRLQNELHRAVRLVVDTGLHAKGWSRQQTIQYIMQTQGVTEDDARRATERYMVWVGQALSYKTGELKILELRRRAEAALGTRFDLKAFHDEVLGAGALPLAMLETRIDAWIVRIKKTA